MSPKKEGREGEKGGMEKKRGERGRQREIENIKKQIQKERAKYKTYLALSHGDSLWFHTS